MNRLCLALLCFVFSFAPVGCAPEPSNEKSPRALVGTAPESEIASESDKALPQLGAEQSPTDEPLVQESQPPNPAEFPLDRIRNRMSRPLADMAPEQLVAYLQDVDRDLQLVASGRAGVTDRKDAHELMQLFEKKKLEAALKLKNHDAATDSQRVDGSRGQLQALSHLASMGDLASAKSLKVLATQNLKSDDEGIVMDSRLVLIGFAIDDMQAGDSEAADRVVSLVDQLTQNSGSDIPAILTLGQARDTLTRYGQVDQAAAVRAKIMALYGSSSDPVIAQVAAQAAGSAKFDVIERLLQAILENENVAIERWADAVIELTTESPDMNAVSYLGLAALRLESSGRDRFVDETMKILEEQFADPNAATTREVAIGKARTSGSPRCHRTCF